MQLTGSEIVIECLKEQGVDTVFGYPGGAILNVYDELYKHSDEITHILTSHEQGAAHAADGYARATGKVGVCFATSGPGATNLVTGIATAYMDSIPIVAITCNVGVSLLGKDSFQEIDIAGITMPITKHNFIVKDVKDLAETIRKAFVIAKKDRPGPVLIDIPKDVAANKAEYKKEAIKPVEPSKDICEDDIQTALKIITKAKKPYIFVGGGAVLSGASEELYTFAKKVDAPVTDSLMGKGAFPGTDPLYTGMLGMHGTKAANFAVQECDLLIAVGARFDDRVTGKLNTFAPHASVIHMDIDPAEMNKLRQAHAALQGDLNALLPALQQPLNIDDWQQHCAQLRDEHAWRYDHPGDAIYAPLLLKQLSDRKPADCVVTTDVGQHQMWAAQHIVHTRPENFITSSGLGTMGFGLPAAVGAQVARPNDTVVCISGDGSFMMNVQELGTVKRKQLPLKIVLLDNQRLGMVRQWQQLFFQERYSETTLTDNPDFLMLASAFGIHGQHITRKDQVEAALDTMLNSDGPYLLHVSIDELENVWPLVPPGASNSEMLEKLS